MHSFNISDFQQCHNYVHELWIHWLAKREITFQICETFLKCATLFVLGSICFEVNFGLVLLVFFLISMVFSQGFCMFGLFVFFCFFLFVIFLTGRKIIFIFLFLEIFYQSFTQNLLFSDESRKSEARSWGTNLICSTEEIRCYSVYLSLWQL